MSVTDLQSKLQIDQFTTFNLCAPKCVVYIPLFVKCTSDNKDSFILVSNILNKHLLQIKKYDFLTNADLQKNILDWLDIFKKNTSNLIMCVPVYNSIYLQRYNDIYLYPLKIKVKQALTFSV
jgi:hypothetical protein